MNDERQRSGDRRLDAAARLARVPPARIRYFVRVGLVRPSRVEGRVAFFGEAELARLRRIRRLGDDLGLNVAGIEVALRLIDEIESLRAQLGSQAPRAPGDRAPTIQVRQRQGGSNGRL